ncbi:uracil phosphoribosyltransferase, putative [Ichthyophthirius multifiliis]|uniref:uracil phosphoribosyltransferase n=1 Tax=Ichthyophthirius multifiliis TaxID=5932 RepID=G0QWJ9_ICHMU|nr:uracil phosphoribosyltransferase, putative [Ichthyophthirius multifiliis]EGR30412.1 uracil phosphoribosyltransferase, putative [Ichthyophthirius multifiliis]|eukprot:XP_004031999.1 uracil phosphoribosyltransferase, putative [Ichthyophthirius multifiliis]
MQQQINTDKKYLPFLTVQQQQDLLAKYNSLTILPENQTRLIFSKIRNQDTPTSQFRHHADRIMRLLIETALNMQDTLVIQRESPCSYYDSVEIKQQDDFIAVTIMRAGNSFLHELLQIMPDIEVGQILLQRDEATQEKKPILYYTKLPKNIKNKKILLFDPMIATGGSVIKAIEELIKVGIQEKDITFVNLIACEFGLKKLFNKYPNIQVVTGSVDPMLIEETKYIAPGLGDFGDRYFGTN